MAHFDLVSPRPQKDGSTRWFKVGAAFPRDKGGFQLVFDALPLPDAEGRVSLMMWEAKPREDNGTRQQSARQSSYDAQRPQSGGYGGSANLDEGEIPFAPEVRI